MCLSHDDQFVFTGSHGGALKQWYIHPQANSLILRKDWSEVFINTSSILVLLVSYDNEYLLMGDREGYRWWLSPVWPLGRFFCWVPWGFVSYAMI